MWAEGQETKETLNLQLGLEIIWVWTSRNLISPLEPITLKSPLRFMPPWQQLSTMNQSNRLGS